MTYVATQFTLADAIHAVETRAELKHSAKRRVEIVRDIRIVAGWLDREPAEIPASIYALQEHLRQLHHAQLGVSKRRFQNILSSLRRGLEAVRGVHDVTRLRPETDLPQPWLSLYAEIPTEKAWVKGMLNSFIRWCADNNVAPRQVTKDTFDQWSDWRRVQTVTLARDPDRAVRRAMDAWNHAARTLGWPVRVVQRETRRTPVTRPLTFFTEAFQHSVQAFIVRNSAPDQTAAGSHLNRWLDDDDTDERFPPLAPRTMRTRRDIILLAATAVIDAGMVSRHDLLSVDQVATPEAAAATFEAALTRSGNAPTEYALTIVKALRNVAARQGLMTDREARRWATLKRRLVKIGGLDNLMTPKNRQRLAPFLDDRVVRRLAQLPSALVEHAEAERRRHGRITRTVACRVQVAAAVALLLTLPVRRSNLATIEIDRHIDWPVGRRNCEGFLHFDCEEVKTKRGVAAAIPADWMTILRLYRRDYWPVLCDTPGNPYLFPAATGLRPKDPNDLSRLVTVTIARETGLSVNLHLFRHICAALIVRSGGNAEDVTALLGQVRDSRALLRYVEFQSATAAAKLDAAISARRPKKGR
ncbi:hypothetical protein C882_0646 [Caenispirillum salinarum AK4]|uniref:Tyr recombinase domain-containing protein n=1 Tax=Caenispirillum salinarum AK4 TaxID=1238182 RepID=K9HEF8_9PROT|nr:hypothetical protein [Caenispirillum salinarum]EKV28883.1 hypothetical protein C882_0646 [Caenispirillum salinarum AK4]